MLLTIKTADKTA